MSDNEVTLSKPDDVGILPYASPPRRPVTPPVPLILKLQVACFVLFLVTICMSFVGIRWAQRVEGSEFLRGTAKEDTYELVFGGIPFLAALLLLLMVVFGGLSLRHKNTPDWAWY
ncbi:MAG TPA: hypothetical protein VL282_17135, partial [Tepidisphaeraceae bacterium]|nr:hypothetical protein [Tepidisphaeraceae bacterium]